MKIMIGFSSPNKWKLGAESIKWWSSSKYSHVYIRFESSNPKVPSTVYHAAHGMVHFRTFDKFKEDNIVIKEYTIDTTLEDRTDILVHCMELSGEPYGTMELITIFAKDLLHYLGKDLKTKDGKGYICSELVGSILIDKFGYKFDKPTYLLKPTDIDGALNGKN